MFCLRRIIYATPVKIINRYAFESKRTISLFQKIFHKYKVRVPLEFDIKEYKPIYTFKLVSTFCRITRRKYMMYGLSLLMIFGGVGFYYLGHIDNDLCFFFTSMGIFNVIVVALVTGLAKNVVGKIYANKDLSKVFVSFGNGSGKRVNKIYDVADLILEDHPNPMYRQVSKRIAIKETQFHYNLCNFLVEKDDLSFYRIFPRFK